MLSILAFTMVTVFMTAIMTSRLSAISALILVPVLFAVPVCLIEGIALAELGGMMLGGIKEIAPTGVMLIFAVLYFAIMIDAGLFIPLVDRVVQLVGGDPVRIMIGTAILALVVSLDGDGATTYMITTAAMLPLFHRMKLDLRMMACVIIMAGAVMNILPWGGPTARVATALKVEPAAIFVPLIPAMAATACWVIFVAYRFGLRERARLAARRQESAAALPAAPPPPLDRGSTSARPDWRYWANAMLTATLMALLIMNAVPLPVLFVIAFALAVTLNYPRLQDQRRGIEVHAGNALAVGGMIFAAGIFTGILNGTGMAMAMTQSIVDTVPAQWGPYLAPITATLSAPLTFFVSNDAFYFGMMPILANTGAVYGISPEAIGRASLVGQQIHLLSPLVPSTYLLVGIIGIEFGEHQRFTFRWAMGSFAVFFLAAVATSAFPIVAG